MMECSVVLQFDHARFGEIEYLKSREIGIK